MKKNKGFTLIELLAAIVILGILLVAAAPTILNMIETNRNKMYVDAAKKLISNAEYQVRAKGSNIEKPRSGEVAVISLVYLDSSDFDNPPGNGEFLKEASFVVVKNTGVGLEYSATIVEKLKKGGYKGIELTSNANLLAKDAIKYVKTFKEDEIVFVQKNKIGKVLEKNYINTKLGKNGVNYCNDISAIYNYPDLPSGISSDDGNADGTATIKSLSMVSASNKEYNSFDAVLTVEVTGDKDTRKDLKVYTSLTGYNDALSTSGTSFGVADVYSKNFDFSSVSNGKYDGTKITVYVVVKDKAGNTSKKQVAYTLHTNRAPIIDTKSSAITKRSEDRINLPKASFKLNVTDDIDETADLDVCITSVKGAACSEYKKYSSYFGSSNTMDYDFGGIPDGRGMGFTVYVRDKYGLVTNADFDYQIYENQAPSITDVKITSESDKFISSGHLKAKIRLTATDDLSTNNLTVKISSSGAPDVTLKYNEIGLADYSYEFAGKYDGGSRNITFYVTDEYGKTATTTKQYQVYKNKPPVIETASVVSNGFACSNTSLCPLSSGGAIDASINLKVTDDIDHANDYDDLLVCVSEEEGKCDSDTLESFDSYRIYRDNNYTISFTPNDDDNPYDGSTRTVYFAVVDTYGEVTTRTVDYKLYKNQEPSITNFVVESEKDPEINDSDFTEFLPFNLKTAKVKLSAVDDGGTDKLEVDICRKSDRTIINEEGEEVEAGEQCDGYREFASSYDIEFDDDVYEGQEYELTVNVKDEYGVITSKTTTYKLYEDKAPIIDDFKIESKSSDYNTKNISLSYTIKDPLDTYSICLGPSADYETCADGAYYVSSDGEFSNKYEVVNEEMDLPIEYDGESRDFYLVVRDSNGHVVSKMVNYAVYSYCRFVDDSSVAVRYYLEGEEETPEGGETPPEGGETTGDTSSTEGETPTGDGTTSTGGETPSTGGGTTEGGEGTEDPPAEVKNYIDANSCDSKCYRDGENPLEVKYQRFIEMRDLHFADYDCSTPMELVTRDCSFHLCYQKDETEYYQAVGTKKVELDWTHEVDGEEHVHSYYYKIYNVLYDEKEDKISFVETAEKACPDAFDAGYYMLINNYVLTKDE